jgi:hypothetical protein
MTDFTYEYQLLNRLLDDCENYLNNRFFTRNIWGITVPEHMAKMYELWQILPLSLKPEWLTWEQLEEINSAMFKNQPTNKTKGMKNDL